MFLTSRERIDDYTARGWWGDLTVDDLLQRNRAEVGGRPALVDPANRQALDGQAPRRLTWAQLGDEVDRTATTLLDAGLRKDDIVFIQPPNIVETVILVLACARIGLIISPAVMQYREHELAYILDILQPAAFITVARFAGHDHAQMALNLRRPDLQFRVLTISGEPPPGAADLAAAARTADPAEAAAYHAAQPAQAGEVFTICWTSGTEARPKGVPRDHNHWIVNAKVVAEATDLRDGETVLNPFPLVNIASFGMVMPWLLRRGVMVLHHPFDLPVFLRQIADEKVNYTIAPPAVLNTLLKSEQLLAATDLSSVRAIGSGSAPLSPWMIEGFLADHGIEVCNIFGSNEGASLFSGPLHVPDPGDRARYFPRMGAPGVHWDGETAAMIRTRLVDPSTEIEVTAPGIPGELRIDGAATFSGYYKAPALNAAAFDGDGWFKTGDLFEIAGEGDLARYYRFVGRCKDIIVRGGVNISPAEIDDLLAGWPAAREAAVVGVPDEVLGERMCVAVVPSGEAPSLAEVTDWLKKSGLAVFKLPERIAIVEALPRNAMNKVVRGDLRALVLGMGE
jgi:cyclohexanecarboxylate-CoA ligase